MSSAASRSDPVDAAAWSVPSTPQRHNGEVSKELETDIDGLYQLPLGEFTAARNALAKSLSGDAKKRVSALAKPTVVPWSLNQLYWRAREVYDQTLTAGRVLRDAHIAALNGRKANLRHATDSHRQAIAQAVRRTLTLAAEHGVHPPPEQVARMLEMLSLSRDEPRHEGRFTTILLPSGFEALAGITPAVTLRPMTPAAATPRGPRNRATPSLAVVPKPAAETTGVVATREEKAAARRAELERRRAERTRARELVAVRKRTEREQRAAEQSLATARAAEARAQADVSRAQAQLARAREDVERAEQEVMRVRTVLESLNWKR